MDFGKYKVSIIFVLLILIIAVFVWKRKGEKLTSKSKRKGSGKEKMRSKKAPRKANDVEDEDEERPSNQSGSVDDAKELFDLVHNDMASGMQIEAFEDVAGDLAGDDPSETFVNLKQKYTQAIDDNKDPSRSVTMKDYVQVLQKS